MTAPWRKLARDLWSERTRAILVVVAIAIGIAGFGAVLSTYAILVRELNQGYLATRPASATFTLGGDVDDALLAALRARPDVAEAEASREAWGRIRVGPAQWKSLRLFVAPDFAHMRIAKLSPDSAGWPPADGEMWIERDAVQVARASAGDVVTLKTRHGDETTIRVGGVVHDVGQAQARMENVVYGYVTPKTLAQLGESAAFDRAAIVVAGDASDAAHVRAVAADVETWLNASGHAVERVDVPKPGEHPHAAIMGLLLLVMASFGAFALVLSGVLVLNLVSGLVASQTRQIGVMKAVGGTRAQIARIYLGEALLLGGAAFLAALPAAVLGCRALCGAMSRFLNFDVTSWAIPAWVYGLEAAAGLAVPLAAAAIPVWRGTAVSTRDALDRAGAGSGAFGTRRLDRMVARAGGPRALAYALRNALRRRGRLALSLVTLSMAALFFLSARNVRASFVHTLDRLFETRRYDLAVGLGAMVPFEKVERAVSRLPEVRAAEGWIATEASVAAAGEAPSPPPSGGLHAGGLHGGGSAGADRFTVLGLPATTSLLRPRVVEGRWLEESDDAALVVNGALAARLPNVRVGSTVTLQMGPGVGEWRLVGIVREPFSPPAAYVPRSFFEVHGGHAGMANTARLAVADASEGALRSVEAKLDAALLEEGVHAQSCTSKADSRFGFDQHMLMIYVFLAVVSGVLALVGGLGIATTTSLEVMERRREMGVLRAIGAAPATVWRLVVVEASVVGIASFALAALLAWPISEATGNVVVRAMTSTSLDFEVDPLGLAIALVATVALAAAASFVPAWRASRRPVREAIGYE
jgi:putative ABC transport system permease protein